MADFKFKQYTEQESTIYDEAISKIRSALANGLTFNEACSSVNIENHDLKGFIISDALKIMIADLHYGKGKTLVEVADILNVPFKTILHANQEMLEEVGSNFAGSLDIFSEGHAGNA